MGAGCAAEEESSCVGRARTRRQGDRAPDVSVCVCAPRRALVALQRRSEPGGGLLEARRPGPAPSRRAVRAAGLECRGRRGPRGPCACPGQPPSRTRLPDARAMHAQPQTQATPPRCACMPPPPPTNQPASPPPAAPSSLHHLDRSSTSVRGRHHVCLQRRLHLSGQHHVRHRRCVSPSLRPPGLHTADTPAQRAHGTTPSASSASWATGCALSPSLILLPKWPRRRSPRSGPMPTRPWPPRTQTLPSTPLWTRMSSLARRKRSSPSAYLTSRWPADSS